MEVKKYFIKCDCCGKKIYFGDNVYQFGGYCGCYCSPSCFTSMHAESDIVNKELAENCCKEVYREEQVITITDVKVEDLDEI